LIKRRNKVVLPLYLADTHELKNKILTGNDLSKKKFAGLKTGVLFKSSRKMRNGGIAQHQ
jgi:hypothetical protein